jgi:hypothetical protein
VARFFVEFALNLFAAKLRLANDLFYAFERMGVSFMSTRGGCKYA